MMYGAFALGRLSRLRSNLVLLVLAALFPALNAVWPGKPPGHGGLLGPHLSAALFVPWFWMFLVGVLFQRNSVVLRRWLAGRFVYVALAYVLLASFAMRQWQWSLKDSPQPLLFLGLACVTFSAAFSAPALSQRLLRRNDVSYGLYIYHEPVANVLLLTAAASGRAAVILAIAVSLVLAGASWVLIERPALALKRHPLYVHADRG
jgi:peptidoglycan/LPS O-acetylase OafA/YrhL